VLQSSVTGCEDQLFTWHAQNRISFALLMALVSRKFPK